MIENFNANAIHILIIKGVKIFYLKSEMDELYTCDHSVTSATNNLHIN